MKAITITETISKPAFEAFDGTVFTDKDECIKYEQSADSIINYNYSKLVKDSVSEYKLLGAGTDEYMYEFLMINSEEDVKYVTMQLKRCGNLRDGDCENLMQHIGEVIIVGRTTYDEYYAYIGTKDDILNQIITRFNNVKC